jgi:hypothetical protein
MARDHQQRGGRAGAPKQQLGADDRLFTVVPTSHLAWHGISHAVDHLDMYLNALVEHRMSFAIAPQSLARSGLLGAAHALWLLDAPSRRERQLRGLRIAHEEWRNERNAYQKLIDSGQAVSGMKGLVEVRTEWMKRAITTAESIGFESKYVKTKPNDTDLIEEVIDRYKPHVPSEPGDMSLSATYLLMWRILSGATHGYRWAVMPRVTFPDADDLDPHSPDAGGHLTHDEEQHVLAVEGLALLISRAFDLYNIRRVPHTAGLALPVLPRRRSAHPAGVTAHPHPLDTDSGGLRWRDPADGYASPKISLPLDG